MECVGIIGLGLIGGSLAKALKNNGVTSSIVAYDKCTEYLDAAKKEQMIDVVATDIDERFSSCDFVFVCTPVTRTVETVSKLRSIVRADCVITDVGSTKHSISHHDLLTDCLNFIGGHPMTGSEKSGYDNSDAHLFENIFYIITPSDTVSEDLTEKTMKIIKQIGAIPIVMDSKKHDHVVAAISHMPHIIASALVNTVQKADHDKSMHLLAAGGFKDITRIASSNPEMWQNICFDNKEQILSVLSLFKQQLNEFEWKLNKEDNMVELFQWAKEYRDTFPRGNRYLNIFELNVDIVDKPGSIATIATLLSVNNINIKNIGINNNREHKAGVLSIRFGTDEEMKRAKELLESINYKVYEM